MGKRLLLLLGMVAGIALLIGGVALAAGGLAPSDEGTTMSVTEGTETPASDVVTTDTTADTETPVAGDEGDEAVETETPVVEDGGDEAAETETPVVEDGGDEASQTDEEVTEDEGTPPHPEDWGAIVSAARAADDFRPAALMMGKTVPGWEKNHPEETAVTDSAATATETPAAHGHAKGHKK